MKKIVFSLLIAVCIFTSVHSASAHVLITDDTNTKGAILHIIPDDDPIAGQQATLYFDTQDQLLEEGDSVSLTITEEAGSKKTLDAKIDGSLVTTNFAFPVQGMYEITYTVASKGNTYNFRQSQRVSRGPVSNVAVAENYAWAEMLLVASGISFAFLAIVAFNRRKDIARQSKF